MRKSRRFVAALILACLAPLAALGRSAERVLPGQKMFGELDHGDAVTVLVDGVAGTSFSASCKAFKGTSLRVDIALASPGGTPVDLTGRKKTSAAGNSVSFAGVVLPATGSYRLTVTALGATFGGFDLVTKGAAPSKLAGAGEVTGASPATIAFGAAAGDRVTCTVKPAKRSPLRPLIHRFVDAGGGVTLIDAARQTTPADVATTGTQTFEIAGADGTAGPFTWSLKFTRAKAAKTAIDAAAIEAAGEISGVIVLDGQSTRDDAVRTAKAPSRRARPDVKPGEIVVALPGAASRAAVEAAVAASLPGAQCTVTAALSEHGPYLVRIEELARRPRGEPRAKSVTRALAKSAAAAPSIAWAEPNALAHMDADPNDTRYVEQFYLRQLGLQRVWDRTEGDAAVVVAVVDSGSVQHPDLIQVVSGGYDFVSDPNTSDDGDGWDPSPADASNVYHGLHVAGVIGARANNKSGIAGVVWKTKIVPVRALGHDGYGSWFDIAAAVRWAAGLAVPGVPANPSPARVINMSLGGAYSSETISAEISNVHAQTQAVIVAAAGNEASSAPHYPAAYPGVIPVYALDANFYWASYSNYGSWISIGAPGGDMSRGQAGILSTYVDTTTGKPNYAELQGTSMATPQVAGIVALLIAAVPGATRAEIRTALEKSALDLGPPGFDEDFGWGMVDAPKALEYLETPFAPPNAIDVAPASLAFEGVANLALVAIRTKAATPVTIDAVDETTSQGGPWLTATLDQSVTPATLTVAVDPLLEAGVFLGNVRLSTSAGVVDVPVRAVRAPRPKIGFANVAAVDATGRVVAQATTNEAKGWAYTLKDVPLGRYRITALADVNANLVLDRVDEWDGVWPLRTQPEFVSVDADALDTEHVDMPLERYDTRLSFSVGGGTISGAFAVRALDAVTRRPIAGAKVHIGSGAAVAVTDARGRAVFVGGVAGGQTITLVAEGYGNATRAGFNGQFQTFELEPAAARATVATSVTVSGLGPNDRSVMVAVGDALATVAYAGTGDLVVPLVVGASPESIPVSVVAAEADGQPSRGATLTVEALGPDVAVAVAPLAIGRSQARFMQPSLGGGTFTTSGAVVRATTSVRFEARQWMPVGDSPMALGQNLAGWWSAPDAVTPALPMRFEVSAVDTAGRSLRRFFLGNTDSLQPSPAAFAFDPAPGLTAPAAGATNVALTPTLTFTTTSTAALHRLVIEDPLTSNRWTVWILAGQTSFAVPLLPAGGLAPATTYRWSVETFRFADVAFNATSFRDEALDTDPASRVFSGWQTFRTQ